MIIHVIIVTVVIDWNYNYSALLEYGREFGHCNVPPEVQYQCILEGVGENGSDLQYEGSLGQWLQNEVSILRGRITAKTAHTRPYFQQLVDEGMYVLISFCIFLNLCGNLFLKSFFNHHLII